MKSIEFFVNKVKYIDNLENIDIDFIPSISRRRMSKLDKITASSINSCMTCDIENIVFSSRAGEIEQLLKIISQYQNEGEASPATFSGSVHNSAVSAYLLNIKKTISYTALSAGENSIESGLMASVCSKYDNNIFVYSEIEDDNYVSLCLNISKVKKENSKKYRICIENLQKGVKNIKDFADFFLNGSMLLETNSYKIERVSDE